MNTKPRPLTLALVLSIALTTPLFAQTTDPLDVLKSDTATLKDKADACRALAVEGGAEAVPVLAPMLLDEELSHYARNALEPMPFPAAGAALREALGKTTGRLQIGVINSLAIRKDAEAVPAIAGLLSAQDAAVVDAAARALGVIGGETTVQALQRAMRQGGTPIVVRAVADGLFDLAETMEAAGDRRGAAALYDTLRQAESAPTAVRTAAARGAVLARVPAQAVTVLAELLREDDEAQFDAALRTSREMNKGPTVTETLAAALADVSADRQIRIIQVLGQRGGKGAGTAVAALAKEGPGEVRVTAIGALARMGYRPSLNLLKRLSWTEEGEVATAARDALAYFPGEEGDVLLEGMLEHKNAKARVAAVEMIGAGGLKTPGVVLMRVAKDDKDSEVRVTALRALREHAGSEELPALLDHLIAARTPEELQAAEQIATALCVRQQRVSAVDVTINAATYGALPDGPTADVRKALRKLIEAGSTSIEVSNSLFGDPARGIPKSLGVEYTQNGVQRSKIVREKEVLQFGTPSVPDELVEQLEAGLGRASGDAKLAMVRLLGTTASPMALETVLAASKDSAVQETALRVVCDWPTTDALPTLMGLAESAPSATLKALAIRGAVRLVGQSDADASERLMQFETLMASAKSANEQKLVIGGLAQMHHPGALRLALARVAEAEVKAEAVQAAVAIAEGLGNAAKEEKSFFNGTDLSGWQGTLKYWSVQDGAIVGHSDEPIPQNEFLWAQRPVGDFYLAVDVRLEPNTANGGIQFRAKRADATTTQAIGYQADAGAGWWGTLYHEHGRKQLFTDKRAESAVKPGQWNRYEILAVGPALWTAINGTLGVAYLDTHPEAEMTGQIAFQIHAGAPLTASYKIRKLVHNPKVELAGMDAEALFNALQVGVKVSAN